MIRTSRSRRRQGFTLLEVLLASVIAVLLLGALYVAIDITLRRTEVNREVVAMNDLSRAVLNRMGSDLSQTLGPMPPKSGGGTSTTTTPMTTTQSTTDSSSSGTGTTSGTTTSGTSGTGTGTTSSSSTTTSSTTTTNSTDTGSTEGTTPTIPAGDIPFQAGIVGSDRQLTLFVSRLPSSLTNREAAADPSTVLPTDLRRITYYMAPDGSGLCRQERPWVTADGIRNGTDPDLTDPAGDLIAPEVRDFTVEYYSGGTWQGEWDGTLVAADGVAATGPPRAVRITLTLEVPGPNRTTVTRQVQHVFPVRAAIGTYQPPTTDGGTTDPTTGGM